MTEQPTFKFTAEVWLYDGAAAWHFASLPKKLSETLHKLFDGIHLGFGSIPVTVTVGSTSWDTSVFKDTKRGTYLLPLKAPVRKKEKIQVGKKSTFTFVVRV